MFILAREKKEKGPKALLSLSVNAHNLIAGGSPNSDAAAIATSQPVAESSNRVVPEISEHDVHTLQQSY